MSTLFFKYPTSLLRDSKPHTTSGKIHSINSKNFEKCSLVTDRSLIKCNYKYVAYVIFLSLTNNLPEKKHGTLDLSPLKSILLGLIWDFFAKCIEVF
jgi:hypothetical protein